MFFDRALSCSAPEKLGSSGKGKGVKPFFLLGKKERHICSWEGRGEGKIDSLLKGDGGRGHRRGFLRRKKQEGVEPFLARRETRKNLKSGNRHDDYPKAV